MARIGRSQVEVDLPDGLQVGDSFAVEGRMTISEVTQIGVDVTTIGGPRQFVAGENEYDLVLEVATATG